MRTNVVAIAACIIAARLLTADPSQKEQDEYTQYELLAPDTASFKITYEVTATTPGARLFFNPIRKGSVASDEAVFDMMTGAPLQFEQVSSVEAKTSGLTDADSGSDYIRVHLARQMVTFVKNHQAPAITQAIHVAVRAIVSCHRHILNFVVTAADKTNLLTKRRA